MEEQKTKKSSLIMFILGILAGLIVVGGIVFMVSRQNTTTKKPETSTSPSVASSSSSLQQSESSVSSIIMEPSNTPIPPTVSPSNTPIPPSNTPEPPTSTPTPEAKADLYISEYSFNHPPKMGEAFTVKIGIYNKGNKASTGFWWEWWATSAIKPCRVRIDSLAAHGGRIVYCTYTYPSWSTYTTKAVADVDNEVVESDEGNNTHSQSVVPIH